MAGKILTVPDFLEFMEEGTAAWRTPWTEEPGRLVHGITQS